MPFKHYPSIAMQSKQLLLGLICFSFALPLYTEEAANLPSEEEEECSLQNPSSFRISAAQREGRGIGYNEGYSSIDGFSLFQTFVTSTLFSMLEHTYSITGSSLRMQGLEFVTNLNLYALFLELTVFLTSAAHTAPLLNKWVLDWKL